MKDLYNNVEEVTILQPVVVTGTATHTDIDLAGFNSACIVVSFGVDAGTGLSSSHKLTFVLQDSDDGTTYANVETADMIDCTVTSGVIFTLDSTDLDNTTYKFGYAGDKRYLQLVYTETGTVSCPMMISLLKGHPTNSPVA